MDLSFEGKTAVVTGASEGIGFATAELFGKLGAKVAICARNKDKLKAAEDLLKEEGIDVYTESCDVSKSKDLLGIK